MLWTKRVLLALGVSLLAFVFGWVPYWLGGVATTRKFQFPDKENAGLTPRIFQLPSEDVSFKAPDGTELRGWWVPAADAKGSVVLAHGLNRSRIEMVKKVPFLHGLGWNALLFDMRHHGESGGAATTFGDREKDDVRAATALARARASGPVVLWGVSLGAASVILAAAEDPTVAGVVGDSSYRSLPDTVHHHMSALPRLSLVGPDRAALADRRRGALLDGPSGRVRSRGHRRARRRRPSRGPARALRGQHRGPAHAQGDRLRAQGSGGRRGPWSFSCPARATAAPGATAPPPTRPR